jgi:hypothetical protein
LEEAIDLSGDRQILDLVISGSAFIIDTIVSLLKPVGISTGYGLDGHGLIPCKGNKNVCTPHRQDRIWGSYPTDIDDSFVGVRRPGREPNHSPSSSAEVNNGGAIPPLPHMSS